MWRSFWVTSITSLLLHLSCFGPAVAGGRTVQVCNFAPYNVRLSLVEIAAETKTIANLSKILGAGACHDFPVSRDAEYQQYVYAEGLSGRSLRRLDEFDDWRRAWPKGPSWGGGEGGTPACLDLASFKWSRFFEQGDFCTKGEQAVSLYDGLLFDENQKAYWNIVDYAMCRELRSFKCEDVSIDALLTWSRKLENGLNGGLLDDGPDLKVHPTNTGLRFMDHNGPFEPGIKIYRSIGITPLGSPVQLKPNDILLNLNGREIFHHDEAIKQFYLHAVSGGVDEPYTAVVQRDEQILSVQGYMYFDEDLVGKMFLDEAGQCKLSSNAAILATLEEFSFYTLRYINCAPEKAASDYKFEGCIRNRSLFLAAYKQFCPTETFAGTVLGGFWFPARGAAERVIFGAGTKAVSAAAKLRRVLVIEGGEEGVRTALTLCSTAMMPDRSNRVDT